MLKALRLLIIGVVTFDAIGDALSRIKEALLRFDVDYTPRRCASLEASEFTAAVSKGSCMVLLGIDIPNSMS